MRTNIEIDDTLMRAALKATGTATKKAAVEAALSLAVELHRQGEAVRKLRGLGWEGDLDEMRGARPADGNAQPRQKERRQRATAA
jgi:Arc/MetJ family transcription regulator